MSLSIATISLGFIPEQGDFNWILGFYVLAFASYAYLLKNTIRIPIKWAIAVACVLRVSLIFSFPNLSDDIYRFIWDGNCIDAGINPYSSLPSESLDLNISGNTQNLLEQLNSTQYYSVYPPLSQLVFYLGTIGDLSWYSSGIIMKSLLCLAEFGSIYLILQLLASFNLRAHRVLIYALNPLIIVELIGNVHFEALTVFFVLLTIYLLAIAKKQYAGIALALGVSAKMLPLMFFPFVWKHVDYSLRALLIFIGAILLLFSPILLGLEIVNFGQSLDLYFGKFEFNGGIYLLLRTIGEYISGYNLIRYLGPGMALITIYLMYGWWREQRSGNILDVIYACFYSITAYYLLSTTVHPWYLALPLVLSLFTSFRFIVLWTALIILSYVNYSFEGYREVYLVQWIEYSAVLSISMPAVS